MNQAVIDTSYEDQDGEKWPRAAWDVNRALLAAAHDMRNIDGGINVSSHRTVFTKRSDGCYLVQSVFDSAAWTGRS